MDKENSREGSAGPKKEINLKDTLTHVMFNQLQISEDDIKRLNAEKDLRMFEKAKRFIAEERYYEAIYLLKKLIDENKENADYHSWLGYVWLKKGNSENARSEFKKALDVNPEDEMAREHYIAPEKEQEPKDRLLKRIISGLFRKKL